MAIPLNWSERVEPNATGLKDCTYAAGLTGMVYAGFKAFPKGIYTVAEREALERSDDQPNETGASIDDLIVAIRRRYGKSKTKSGLAGTKANLAKTGIGMVIQGHLANFPGGHRLRRWQPGFTGGHAVFVMAMGDGKWRWFDPLAPMKHAGDAVTTAEINTFIKTIGYSTTFKNDEYAPVVVPPPTYTEAQYKAVVAERDAALARATAAESSLVAADAKIAAAKVALG